MPGTLINHRRFSKTHFSHLFIFLFLGWRVCWGSENFAPSCQQKFLSSFPVCGTALYLTYRVQLIFMNESLLFDECRLLFIVSRYKKKLPLHLLIRGIGALSVFSGRSLLMFMRCGSINAS